MMILLLLSMSYGLLHTTITLINRISKLVTINKTNGYVVTVWGLLDKKLNWKIGKSDVAVHPKNHGIREFA